MDTLHLKIFTFKVHISYKMIPRAQRSEAKLYGLL